VQGSAHEFSVRVTRNINLTLYEACRSQGSSVSTVNVLRTGRPGFDSRQGQGLYLFSTASRPPNQGEPGVKRPGRESDHSPPYSAKVKNVWSYISTPPYVLMACLIKLRIRHHGVVLYS